MQKDRYVRNIREQNMKIHRKCKSNLFKSQLSSQTGKKGKYRFKTKKTNMFKHKHCNKWIKRTNYLTMFKFKRGIKGPHETLKECITLHEKGVTICLTTCLISQYIYISIQLNNVQAE